MTIEEAQDIATVLKAGKLPAAARIIESRSCWTFFRTRINRQIF